MEKVIFLFLSACFLSGNSFAQGLSEPQQKKLSLALDASAVQLAKDKGCRVKLRDPGFAGKTSDRAIDKHAPWATVVEKLQLANYIVGGVAAIAFLPAGSVVSTDDDPFLNKWAPRSSFVSIASVVLAHASSSILEEEERSRGENLVLILNDDKLNIVAEQKATELAEVFSLSLSEKATLRAAIKAEALKMAHRRKKNKDDRDGSELDLYEVMKNASYRGKPILSEEKRAVLDRVAMSVGEDLPVAPEKLPTLREQVGALVAFTSMLEACVNTNKLVKEVNLLEMRARVQKNAALLKLFGEGLEEKKDFLTSPAETKQNSAVGTSAN